MLRLLLDQRASPDAQDGKGRTPILLACGATEGGDECVGLLLDKGAKKVRTLEHM